MGVSRSEPAQLLADPEDAPTAKGASSLLHYNRDNLEEAITEFVKVVDQVREAIFCQTRREAWAKARPNR